MSSSWAAYMHTWWQIVQFMEKIPADCVGDNGAGIVIYFYVYNI